MSFPANPGSKVTLHLSRGWLAGEREMAMDDVIPAPPLSAKVLGPLCFNHANENFQP